MTDRARENIVLDAHSDLLLDVLLMRRRGGRGILEGRFLPKLREAGINALVCSIYIVEELVPEGALRNALDQISALKTDLEESPSFRLCRSAGECYKAAAQGQISLFLSLEGAEPLGRDPLLLRVFHELGVRLLGLAWSRRNYACDGISFEEAAPYSSAGSLTDFGRELVAEACRLGMVIDVSHLNDAGFRELSRIIRVPFIASHSNCRALTNSPRNLTDEQLGVLAAAGGVVGMNACGQFAAERREERSPAALLAHLDHVVKNFGAAHAGLGLDLCDCLESLAGISDGGDIFKDHADAGRRFIDEIKRGRSEDEAAAILGGNFMRLFERVMKDEQ
ncbi:MAG: membrane dipeptidase [Synergistaceae bacterium]|nr:membrane dipeptidase [Synergistaceae bacterium]